MEEKDINNNEKNNKTNKVLIWIIIILIIIIIVLMSLIIYKGFFVDNNLSNDNNSTTTTKSTTTTTISSKLKIDLDKDWVYDANYAANLKQQTYVAWDKTYNVSDYKVPYININSDYAKKINDEIEKKFYDYIGKVDELFGIDIYKYNYYLNNNILSIVITVELVTTAPEQPIFTVFNIDITNGKEITFEDILKYKSMSESEFDAKAKSAIIKQFDEEYEQYFSGDNDGYYKEYYSIHKQGTLEFYDDDKNKQCYIDNNGKINYYATFSIPAGTDEENLIVVIE